MRQKLSVSSLITFFCFAGIIYLISDLSDVEYSTVLLTVSARDGGGLCSVVNAAVTVRILQTAMAPPVFERSRYTFSVPEDIPEGSAIGTVKAREPLSKCPWKAFRQFSEPQIAMGCKHMQLIL